jgi:hypothetical protein
MPSGKYTRIEITEEAYKGLEAEAVLQGKTLKKLASQLILKSISPKALEFIQHSQPHSTNESADDGEKPSFRTHRTRISDNPEVIKRIKVLWSQDPRPSRREISRIINYPSSSTKYQIRMMLEKGELKDEIDD